MAIKVEEKSRRNAPASSPLNDHPWLKYTQPENWHPAAAAFPRMSETELRELAADIEAHGQHHPVVVLDGKVLDGINRLVAQKLLWDDATDKDDAGPVETQDIHFYTTNKEKGTGGGGQASESRPRLWLFESSPIEYVLSQNNHRRHMTYDQRVAVASELAELLAAEGKERRKATLKKGDAKPVVPKSAPRERAVKQAAKKMDVGKDAVQAVTTAEKEIPGTREKLKAGKTTVAQVQKERKAQSTATRVPGWQQPTSKDMRTERNRELRAYLQGCLRRGKEREALRCAVEFDRVGLPGAVWNCLDTVAVEDIGPADANMSVRVELLHWKFNACTVKKDRKEHKVLDNEPTSDGNKARLFLFAAVMYVARAMKCRHVDNAVNDIYYDDSLFEIPAWAREAAANFKDEGRIEVEDWALDKHTARGKVMGRGIDHFFDVKGKLENKAFEHDPYERNARANLKKKEPIAAVQNVDAAEAPPKKKVAGVGR